jgi:phenylacetate-CoA ligase
MMRTASASAALAFWLAREARPTFRIVRRPPEQIQHVARERLRWVLRKAGDTEFGAHRLTESGLPGGLRLDDPEDALRRLRPVGKAELRAAGRAALAGGRSTASWRSSRSSGSTGEPFQVFYDVRAWAILKYLVKIRARAACGLRWGHRAVLLDAIAPADEGRLALERTGRVRRISVLQPAEQVAARLVAFRPDVIYGLPSALLEAGRHLPGGSGGPTASAVFTSGEVLDGTTRRILREQYGCGVFDVYGTSETKEVAWECPAGAMHVNEDVVRVEVLEPDGTSLPEGEEGEIVLTLLVNGAMPLIRYRTGDRGSLIPGACSCGIALRLLGVVTGREVDLLELSGGRRVSPYVLTSALEKVPGILRYQVIQDGPESLRVRARGSAPGGSADLPAQIRTAMEGVIPGPLKIEVEIVDGFETGPRAKFRVVQPRS